MQIDTPGTYRICPLERHRVSAREKRLDGWMGGWLLLAVFVIVCWFGWLDIYLFAISIISSWQVDIYSRFLGAVVFRGSVEVNDRCSTNIAMSTTYQLLFHHLLVPVFPRFQQSQAIVTAEFPPQQ